MFIYLLNSLCTLRMYVCTTYVLTFKTLLASLKQEDTSADSRRHRFDLELLTSKKMPPFVIEVARDL